MTLRPNLLPDSSDKSMEFLFPALAAATNSPAALSCQIGGAVLRGPSELGTMAVTAAEIDRVEILRITSECA